MCEACCEDRQVPDCAATPLPGRVCVPTGAAASRILSVAAATEYGLEGAVVEAYKRL
jgi:hypothetical protein